MRIELQIAPISKNRVLPINYQYEFSAWVYTSWFCQIINSSKVRLKSLQPQLIIRLFFNSSNKGSIKTIAACKIRKLVFISYSIILNRKFVKMEKKRIIKILEIFKKAERGLDKNSSEFSFLPQERIEFYFDLLEDDYGFIKKFQNSNTNLKYRITALGYDFLESEAASQHPIGF